VHLRQLNTNHFSSSSITVCSAVAAETNGGGLEPPTVPGSLAANTAIEHALSLSRAV